MRVHFLGTGEAFDAERANSSVFIAGSAGLLIDCGPTVPPRLWRLACPPDALDAVCFTHLHGDHVLGLPALLGRLRQDGRRAPLALVGAPGLDDFVARLLDLAYPGLRARLPFRLLFRDILPGRELALGCATLRSAETLHGVRNLAIRAELDGLACAFSGDGRPTPEAEALYRRSDLLVHDAYHLDEPHPTHATAVEAVELARRARVTRLALVHVRRSERAALLSWQGGLSRQEGWLHIPTCGDHIDM